LSVLKFGIEDVNGTTEDMGTFEIGMIGARARPELIRRQTTERFLRDSVVNPNGVVHGQGPEIKLTSSRPVKHKVKEIGLGHARDGSNASFCHAILVMGAYSTERVGLILTCAVVLEG
jgi:hypothetical protein